MWWYYLCLSVTFVVILMCIRLCYVMYQFTNISFTDISPQSKAILVTGAANGMGYSTTKLLLQKGCFVYATDINEEQLKQSFAKESTDKILLLQMDVSNVQSVQAAMQKVKDHLQGRKLFALINNAGIIGTKFCGLVEEAEEFMQKMFQINALGTFRVTKECFPLLQSDIQNKQNQSVIINMASVASFVHPPFMSHYTSSKSAVLGYTDALRRELQQIGIRVIAIAPGVVQTQMAQTGFPLKEQQSSSIFNYNLQSTVDLKHTIAPDYVAKIIAHSLFCSSAPAYRIIDHPFNTFLYYIGTFFLPVPIQDFIIALKGKV